MATCNDEVLITDVRTCWRPQHLSQWLVHLSSLISLMFHMMIVQASPAAAPVMHIH